MRVRNPGVPLMQQVAQPLGQGLFALLDALGRDHELCEVRRGELLIERQEEARCARSDEIDEMVDLRTALEIGFEPPRLPQRGGKRCAFGQTQVDQELGAVGAREELLRHEPESGQRHDEDDHGYDQHPPAMIDAPADPAAQPAVDPTVVNVVMPFDPAGTRRVRVA